MPMVEAGAIERFAKWAEDEPLGALSVYRLGFSRK